MFEKRNSEYGQFKNTKEEGGNKRAKFQSMLPERNGHKNKKYWTFFKCFFFCPSKCLTLQYWSTWVVKCYIF